MVHSREDRGRTTRAFRARRERVTAVRKLVFTALVIFFVLAIWYGVAAGDFLETLSNGVMICLTCIGVA